MTVDGAASQVPWRRDHFESLIAFAALSLRSDGAAQWLDDHGQPDLSHPVHTWITSRMAHCFAVANILGVPDAGQQCDQAILGLQNTLADPQYGGWVASIGPDSRDVDGTKAAYAHAFVVLAAASATIAGRPQAQELLDQALQILDQRFWDPSRQLHADEYSRDWAELSPYRGVNANMHAVEALLAAYDATGNQEWLHRASAITDHVVAWAQQNEWRIPEHFDSDWVPQLEFNADRPRDPFKPYGSTPGHGFEWARLIVQTDIALGRHPQSPEARLLAAHQLYDRAARDGWDPLTGGFVYTVDWGGVPVEPRRFHWVAAEAIAAAECLARYSESESEQQRFHDDAAKWWNYARQYLIDTEHGSWHHELDVANKPSGLTWTGKPDIYHAAQTAILGVLPMAGSVAQSARLSRVD